MTQRLIGALLLVGVLAGCGGDDSGSAPSTAVACPEGTADNTTVACTCVNGASGTGLCQAGFIGVCNCASVGTGSGGTTPPAMSGGTGGARPPMGTGSTVAMGSGGTGGMMTMMMDDGGVDPDSDGGARSGAQGSACAAATDCNNGLSCYNNNFCSKSCTSTADCSGLTGATYTCSTQGMICRVDCMANGNADCPAGFTCQDVNGATRRCMLP